MEARMSEVAQGNDPAEVAPRDDAAPNTEPLPTETGKLLYDVTLARLNAQKESQVALVARSKDLLSVGSIAGTIASIGANKHVLDIEKPPVWWIVGIAAAIAADITCALLALRPIAMTFTASPADLAGHLSNRAFAGQPLDRWYDTLGRGFLFPKHHDVTRHGRKTHESDIDFNQHQNTVLGRLIRVQIASLAAIVGLAVLLLFVL
jgi:hypothetical protein